MSDVRPIGTAAPRFFVGENEGTELIPLISVGIPTVFFNMSVIIPTPL